MGRSLWANLCPCPTSPPGGGTVLLRLPSVGHIPSPGSPHRNQEVGQGWGGEREPGPRKEGAVVDCPPWRLRSKSWLSSLARLGWMAFCRVASLPASGPSGPGTWCLQVCRALAGPTLPQRTHPLRAVTELSGLGIWGKMSRGRPSMSSESWSCFLPSWVVSSYPEAYVCPRNCWGGSGRVTVVKGQSPEAT